MHHANVNVNLIEKQISGGIIKYRCECKKVHVCEKEYVWNPAICNCENGKYLASIMDKTICDEIIDVKETNFN